MTLETFGWILWIAGSIGIWLCGYWYGLDIGNARGRLEYRRLERAKSESK